MRRIIVGALSMTLVLASCTQAAEDTPTTGEATTTTTAAETSTTTAPTTITTREPSAEEALGDFFAAAREADQEIAAAARAFNSGFDSEEGTLTAEAEETAIDLDIGRIDWLIPAGLSIELETAVLTVYSDLISRQAALQGSARYLYPDPEPDEDTAEQNLEFAMTCLGNGHVANARFDADLARAIREARLEAPPPSYAPDSAKAGILAVREAWIVGGNTCCDSCGGYIYSEPIPVDWDGRGDSFDAEFVDGHWKIGLHAG